MRAAIPKQGLTLPRELQHCFRSLGPVHGHLLLCHSGYVDTCFLQKHQSLSGISFTQQPIDLLQPHTDCQRAQENYIMQTGVCEGHLSTYGRCLFHPTAQGRRFSEAEFYKNMRGADIDINIYHHHYHVSGPVK